LDAGIERDDVLVVDATRAHAKGVASLRREEAAEARMATLEMDLVRREAEVQELKCKFEYISRRSILEKLFFGTVRNLVCGAG
jgi:hypothetical protein